MNKMMNKSRLRLIANILAGQWHLFFFALLLSMGSTLFNSLTPQIIRLTVDSVIGSEPLALSGVFGALGRLLSSSPF